MAEPLNSAGSTEQEWNAWREASAAWEASTPPRHMPHEVCDCTDVPLLARLMEKGHCAARGPIVEWGPAVS